MSNGQSAKALLKLTAGAPARGPRLVALIAFLALAAAAASTAYRYF
jgi:hypothetical protein